MSSRIGMALAMLCLLLSCSDEGEPKPSYSLALMETPRGFDPLPQPEGNRYTPARWELGKALFYDTRLSLHNDISCASCHKADLAFADSETVSPGTDGHIGTRNAPSLANVAYHPYYMREGGVPTLEMQALVPIQEHAEFDNNIVAIVDSLSQDTTYLRQSIEAYERSFDAFVLTRALGVFQRSLISGLSKYDLATHYGDETAMNASARRGQSLFFSESTQCSTCHSGPNFTNYSFENNGLYLNYTDQGRFRLTTDSSDIALFKIPSLRNVALTAPYMHDGSLASLAEVIEHYNSGGTGHQHQSPHIKALGLSEQEKTDLKSFLESLTDDHFIQNPAFRQ